MFSEFGETKLPSSISTPMSPYYREIDDYYVVADCETDEKQ